MIAGADAGGRTAERRAHPRAPLKSSAILRFGDRAGGGVTLDLSEGGLRLQTPAPLRMGQGLWVVIELEGGTIEATAHVVHGDASRGWGLKFVMVRRPGMENIRRYVASHTGPTRFN